MSKDWFGLIWGLILGITEYWPVSVSGHQQLASALFGLPAIEVLWGIVLLSGTIAGTVVLLWHDVRKIITAPFGKQSLLALTGAVPLGITNWACAPYIRRWEASGVVLAAGFLLNGCLLWFIHTRSRGRRGLRRISIKEYLALGMLQSLSVFPGLSRMGLLLCGSSMYNLNSRTAVRVSLRISLFVLLGRLFMLADRFISAGNTAVFLDAGVWRLVAGFFTAAAVSYGAGRMLPKLINRGALRIFSVYCFFLACVALGLKMLGNMG